MSVPGIADAQESERFKLGEAIVYPSVFYQFTAVPVWLEASGTFLTTGPQYQHGGGFDAIFEMGRDVPRSPVSIIDVRLEGTATNDDTGNLVWGHARMQLQSGILWHLGTKIVALGPALEFGFMRVGEVATRGIALSPAGMLRIAPDPNGDDLILLRGGVADFDFGQGMRISPWVEITANLHIFYLGFRYQRFDAEASIDGFQEFKRHQGDIYDASVGISFAHVHRLLHTQKPDTYRTDTDRDTALDEELDRGTSVGVPPPSPGDEINDDE